MRVREWLAAAAFTGLIVAATPLFSQEATEKQAKRDGDFRTPDKLKVGDVAPDFTLKSLDGKQTVRLAQFRGQQPVVLIFGSYT